mmetsp:Transcript_17858/g.26419  ORF Transcript_17858/g.26419 Transcript_17858/m.26419 type:complete len:84 (-) Transcript_17858:127-378(-)|eukprot:CAMPEP_0194216402 /NCGR_PEP_ID=MMETSP0156-20130528/18905_1 /TAXON_ID=33649 /ORGANISM="Thalassionema nitzschioides, Strain L26-B" /LENGTH=83 /DNA_ID=CAMNT_0038945165 /DNA_START=149 /DNA_END=400 /DNA_ORIENTATION=-
MENNDEKSGFAGDASKNLKVKMVFQNTKNKIFNREKSKRLRMKMTMQNAKDKVSGGNSSNTSTGPSNNTSPVGDYSNFAVNRK